VVSLPSRAAARRAVQLPFLELAPLVPEGHGLHAVRRLMHYASCAAILDERERESNTYIDFRFFFLEIVLTWRDFCNIFAALLPDYVDKPFIGFNSPVFEFGEEHITV